MLLLRRIRLEGRCLDTYVSWWLFRCHTTLLNKSHPVNLTISQLYVQGELVGGLDIVKEMKHDGALAPQLGVTPKVARYTQQGGVQPSSP